jgi:DNA-binding NtrC family response regulator
MKLNILVIEDEMTLGELMKDILSDMALVDTTDKLDIADNILKNKKIDLIISDYYLGNSINSLDYFETQKKIFENLPIILMSGFPSEEMLNRAHALNINIFLRKPIDFDFLIERVKLLLFDKLKTKS